MSESDLTHALRPWFGDRTDEALHTYRHSRAQRELDTSANAILNAVNTDAMFRIPAIRTAQAQTRHTPDVWFYQFDYPSPAWDGRLGACHSLDIPFIWGTHDAHNMRRFCGHGPHLQQLSDRMMDAWVAFARHGDPNTDHLPHWPRYDTADRHVMHLDIEPTVQAAPADPERALWASLA